MKLLAGEEPAARGHVGLEKLQQHLLRNDGGWVFTDVNYDLDGTNDSGLTSTGRGTTSAWGDYDSDGDLDVYLGNRDNCPPTKAPDRLYRNNGDGTFTDVSSFMGGLANPALNGWNFANSWGDINKDGRLDLYVVNDLGGQNWPNVLWRNDGPDCCGGWIFTDISAASRANRKMAAMGVAIGDYNNDGNFDLAASNIAANALLRNRGDQVFIYESVNSGFQRNFIETAKNPVTWGIGFWDLDNDGREDSFIAAGTIANALTNYNGLMVNNYNGAVSGLANDGIWLDLSHGSGADGFHTNRTVALADFDADGWVDALCIDHYDRAAQLYRNQGAADGNTNGWLQVKLVGKGPGAGGSNLDGVGAHIKLTSASGPTQYRQIYSGTSLGAGSMVMAHFGLGSNTTADLEITWPSGIVQTVTGVAANQRLVVTEP